jgi:hypothetical protein
LEIGVVEEGLIKKLVASMKCGACGQCYELDNIDVLGHQGDLWFLSAFCSVCQAQYLMAAVIKEERISEVITDLTEAELDKFSNAGVVTADEILDMHNFLEDFDGDVSQLFSQDRGIV